MYQFYIKILAPFVVLLLGILYSLDNTVLEEYISVVMRTEISIIVFCLMLLVPMFKIAFEEINKKNFFTVLYLGSASIILLVIIVKELENFFICMYS